MCKVDLDGPRSTVEQRERGSSWARPLVREWEHVQDQEEGGRRVWPRRAEEVRDVGEIVDDVRPYHPAERDCVRGVN